MGWFAAIAIALVVGGLAGLAVGRARRRALEAELADVREVLKAANEKLQTVWTGAAVAIASKNEVLNEVWAWSENGLYIDTDAQEGE